MTDPVTSDSSGFSGRMLWLVEHRFFQHGITTLIIFNAFVLALETSPTAMEVAGEYLQFVDRCILSVFVVELVGKIIAFGRRFPRDPWNLFDLFVVGVALVPATGSLSVLRALRILRVLRLVSTVPSLRRVVAALLHAIPSMGSVITLLAVIFFVFAVMATKLFGGHFPVWFGNIGLSAYTLFQVMTLESWSMGIVRPVMDVFPLAWTFFVPFILITSFAVLNLFIGIIVDAMQTHGELSASTNEKQTSLDEVKKEIVALREEVEKVLNSGR